VKIYVSKDFIGQRIDHAVPSITKDLSRTQFQRYIKGGNVLLDGVVINDPSRKIGNPCTIDITEESVSFTSPNPEDIPVDTVYEDEFIVIVNKAAGMVCHPAPGHRSGTLVNAMQYILGNSLSDVSGELRLGIIHRLDKDTSGLMIVAKTNRAHMEFARLFAEGKGSLIQRKYTCFVLGVATPKDGIIDTFICRHPKYRQRFMATMEERGKHAITHYTIEKTHYFTSTKSVSKIKCELMTGRTHQIRVHMQYLNMPVIGDNVYGQNNRTLSKSSVFPENITNFPRQALHSSELSFLHPFTKHSLNFTAELPIDMKALDRLIINHED
jgi:23S rRNA pseudouridine1911/1915/1917 synthase